MCRLDLCVTLCSLSVESSLPPSLARPPPPPLYPGLFSDLALPSPPPLFLLHRSHVDFANAAFSAFLILLERVRFCGCVVAHVCVFFLFFFAIERLALFVTRTSPEIYVLPLFE